MDSLESLSSLGGSNSSDSLDGFGNLLGSSSSDWADAMDELALGSLLDFLDSIVALVLLDEGEYWLGSFFLALSCLLEGSNNSESVVSGDS